MNDLQYYPVSAIIRLAVTNSQKAQMCKGTSASGNVSPIYVLGRMAQPKEYNNNSSAKGAAWY